MLLNLREFHRPATVAETLDLAGRYSGRAAFLAGGTDLGGRSDAHLEAVVDLAGLPLATLAADADAVTAGAMVTLRQLAADPAVRALAGGILSRAAERSAPATIRAAATLGGTLASPKGGEEVPTVLLALEAVVCLAGPGGAGADPAGQPGHGQTRPCPAGLGHAAPAAPGHGSWELPMAEFLARRESLLPANLITAVRIPVRPGARGGFALVSRTPADRAILCAAAVVTLDHSTVAVGGLAPLPRLLGDMQRWDVISDHRGSSEYRRWVAPVLVRRALNEANGGNGP